MKLNYSELRKRLQSIGEAPEWYTSAGLQLFYEKYAYNEETPKSRYKSIAETMAKHAPSEYPEWWNTDPYTSGKTWKEVFFNVLWEGFVSPSTPMLANSGIRKRGTTVSCSGGNLDNNLFDRYDIITEAAILTKHSHGTSYSIDHWPAEGEPLKRGGRSLGVMPIIRDLINCMDEVTQASRRGSLAYSIGLDHGDFYQVADHLYKNPESNNVGWLIRDETVERLKAGDTETVNRFEQALGVKLPKGKGYFTFIDKCNRHLAEAFKLKGLKFEASNLCQECILPSNHEYTYSCVILCYNLEHYRKWPEHLVFIGQVMSDCNISEYLETIDEMSSQDKRAMRKIKKFTSDFRALGSGVLGYHTLMQQEMIPVASLEAVLLNDEVFSRIDRDSLEASEWLANVLGEPEGCKGLGIRNATRLMMPPTKSTAEIMSGASEGIGLDVAMVFTKQTAGGEVFRINKVLLKLMKERGVYNDENIMSIAKAKGSVQHVDWLTPEEKQVFLTAFEIPMEWVIKLASQRQKYIDQGQSLNLYFTSNDSEEYIGKIHRMAFEDEGILTLYYIYSVRGGDGLVRSPEMCAVCQ